MSADGERVLPRESEELRLKGERSRRTAASTILTRGEGQVYAIPTLGASAPAAAVHPLSRGRAPLSPSAIEHLQPEIAIRGEGPGGEGKLAAQDAVTDELRELRDVSSHDLRDELSGLPLTLPSPRISVRRLKFMSADGERVLPRESEELRLKGERSRRTAASTILTRGEGQVYATPKRRRPLPQPQSIRSREVALPSPRPQSNIFSPKSPFGERGQGVRGSSPRKMR